MHRPVLLQHQAQDEADAGPAAAAAAAAPAAQDGRHGNDGRRERVQRLGRDEPDGVDCGRVFVVPSSPGRSAVVEQQQRRDGEWEH